MKKSSLGFGKIFNVLQSLNGRIASRPMRNIETFPSKQMYLYLSLVKKKVADFNHYKDRSALREMFQYSSLAEKPLDQWEIATD